MFTPDQIRQHVEPIVGPLTTGSSWELLKQVADMIRNNKTLAEKLIGKLPGMNTEVTAYNGGTNDADNYIIGGIFHANTLAREIVKVHALKKNLDILDFGFGAARLIRYFTRFWPQHIYHAAEVNPATLGHLNIVSPEVDGRLITSHAPSPFADESLDVIYAWSIYTHFDEKLARSWLEDMHRVLRPGGCALITLHSENLVERYGTDPMLTTRMAQRGGDYETIVRTYREYGFSFWPAYSTEASNVGIDVDTFGMAFVSIDYVKGKWGDLFDYRGKCVGTPNWQDVVTLVKK